MTFLRLYILLLFGAVTQVDAQSGKIARHAAASVFIEKGIFSMKLDQYHNLWALSEQKVYNFDGANLREVSKGIPDSAALSCLSIGQDGHPYVANHLGHIYALRNGVWELDFSINATDTADFHVTDLALLQDNRVIVATYGKGIFACVDGLCENLNPDLGVPMDIYELEADALGNIWGASDYGLLHISPGSGEIKTRLLGYNHGIPDQIVRTIAVGEGGLIWCGHFDGSISFFDPAVDRFYQDERFQNNLPVAGMVMAPTEELWWGTEGGHIYRMESGQSAPVFKVNNAQNELSFAIDIVFDDEWNAWIIDKYDGLSLSNCYLNFYPLDNTVVQAVLVRANGDILIGTESGVIRLDQQGKPAGYILEGYNIISLYEDRYGVVWAGSFGYGLFAILENGNHIRLTESDGLANDAILSIDGTDVRLWCATLGGVSEVAIPFVGGEKPMIHSYSAANGPGTNFIYSTFVDEDNRAWFGTDGNGLVSYSDGNFSSYKYFMGKSIKAVYSIAKSHNKSLWLNTGSNGLLYLQNDSLSQFDLGIDWIHNEVSVLSPLGVDDILIAYKNGLILVDPNSKVPLFIDPLSSVPYWEPGLNATHSDPARKSVWIGFRDGLLEVKAMTDKVRKKPFLNFTEIRCFDKKISPVDTLIMFNHQQNYWQFDFEASWFKNPRKVDYRYKLEGLDQEWQYTSIGRASYSNLEPGAYTFVVQSSVNNEFLWPQQIEYPFSIAAPIWTRWWFIAILFLAVLTLIWLIVSFRERQMKRIHSMEQQKVASELKVIKSQINPHFLFNNFNALISLIESDPKNAANYAEHLSDFYRSLITYRDKELITIQEELEILHQYYFVIRHRFGDNFILEIDLPPNLSCAIPPLTLQILVENAIKHNVISSSKPLRVLITVEGKMILVSNPLQPKSSIETSTGYGLQSIVKRYSFLSAEKASFGPESGQFIVKLPCLPATLIK
jgi:hypothetical protein